MCSHLLRSFVVPSLQSKGCDFRGHDTYSVIFDKSSINFEIVKNTFANYSRLQQVIIPVSVI